MADRNRTASWIHYPLPQPRSTPTSVKDMQQWTWNFRLQPTETGLVTAARLLRRLLTLGIGS